MGEITLTEERLEELLDRAAEKGAKAALLKVGLNDEKAHIDIQDMRSLLSAWRETRSMMWKTVLQVATMAAIGFISVAVWSHFKYQIR